MGWATLDGVYFGDKPFESLGSKSGQVGQTTVFDQAAAWRNRGRPVTAFVDPDVHAVKVRARHFRDHRMAMVTLNANLPFAGADYLIARGEIIHERAWGPGMKVQRNNARAIVLLGRWERRYGERVSREAAE